ncbi:MAG: hypothetical protein ACE5GX_19640 [Thermoanaerobaculia bacterium]
MKTPELDQEIMLDLLPVYLAGEASAQTQALIDERIKADPDFAQLVEAAKKVHLPKSLPPSANGEMKAFLRVRSRMLLLQLLLGLAVLFTLLFAVSMGFLLETFPQAGAVSFLLGTVCWVAFWLAGKSLS